MAFSSPVLLVFMVTSFLKRESDKNSIEITSLRLFLILWRHANLANILPPLPTPLLIDALYKWCTGILETKIAGYNENDIKEIKWTFGKLGDRNGKWLLRCSNGKCDPHKYTSIQLAKWIAQCLGKTEVATISNSPRPFCERISYINSAKYNITYSMSSSYLVEDFNNFNRERAWGSLKVKFLFRQVCLFSLKSKRKHNPKLNSRMLNCKPQKFVNVVGNTRPKNAALQNVYHMHNLQFKFSTVCDHVKIFLFSVVIASVLIRIFNGFFHFLKQLFSKNSLYFRRE